MFRNTTPRAQFIDAVQTENLGVVKQLLEQKVSPNLVIDVHKKQTAVDYAVSVNNDDLLSLLLHHGGKISNGPKPGNDRIQPVQPRRPEPVIAPETPRDRFIKAVKTGDRDLLELMLPQIANPIFTIDSALGNTALHYACENNLGDIVSLLVKNPKVRLDMRNRRNKTPVDLAIVARNIEVIQKLSEHPDFSKQLEVSLQSNIANKDKDAVTFLLGSFDIPNFDKLSWAIVCNDKEYIDRLLKSGIKPEGRHIEQALAEGNIASIVLDIKLDSLYSPTRSRLLLALAADRRWDILSGIISTNPTNSLDPYGYTYLFYEALKQSNEEGIKILLQAKTPMECLYAPEGVKALNNLRDTEARNIIIELLAAAKHDTELLKFIRTHCLGLPEYLETYFEDPVFAGLLTDPVITPQGTTYNREPMFKWIREKAYDPQTYLPILPEDLRPNHAVLDLYNYYILHSDDGDVSIPLLTNPVTGSLYKEPVVAQDGQTYEKADLIAYLQAHNNELPNRQFKGSKIIQNVNSLYPNKLVESLINEIYLKRTVIKCVKTNDLGQLNKIIASGFSINTDLDEDKNRLIHLAIKANNRELVELCLKAGAALDIRNKKRESALSMAFESEQEELITLLLAKTQDLKQLFKEAAMNNDVKVVTWLLQHYGGSLQEMIPVVVAELIKKEQMQVLEVILKHSQDSHLLKTLDEILPSLIESRNTKVLSSILMSAIPMKSLMSIKGTDTLRALYRDGAEHQALIDALLLTAKTRHPAILFRVEQILKPVDYEEAEFPEEIDELVCDPIDMEPFSKPHLTPTGQTFSYKSIKGLDVNPLNRAPLVASDLRPNLLLADLLLFLQAGKDDVPPMLLSLLSNQMMREPVVDVDGITYEKSELCVAQEPQRDLVDVSFDQSSKRVKVPVKLPDGVYPDLTLTSLCEYFAKRQKPSPVVDMGLFSLKVPYSPQEGEVQEDAPAPN